MARSRARADDFSMASRASAISPTFSALPAAAQCALSLRRAPRRQQQWQQLTGRGWASARARELDEGQAQGGDGI